MNESKASRPRSNSHSKILAKPFIEAEISEYLTNDDASHDTKSDSSGSRMKPNATKKNTTKKESPKLTRGLSKRTIAITQSFFNQSPTDSPGSFSRRSSRSSMNSPTDGSLSSNSSPKLSERRRSSSFSSTNSISHHSTKSPDDSIPCQLAPSPISPQQQETITKIMNLEDADTLFKPPVESYSRSAVPMALLLRKANQLNLYACDSRDSEEEARLAKQRKEKQKQSNQSQSLLKKTFLTVDDTTMMPTAIDKNLATKTTSEPPHNESNHSIGSNSVINADYATSSSDVESVIYKIVLIGNQGVGKTSYLKRYFDNVFEAECPESIGVDFRGHSITLGSLEHKFQLWDITGAERFQPITKTYYKGAHVFGIMCSLSNQESIDEIGKWVEAIHANILEPVQILLILNKADLLSSLQAREDVAKEVSSLLAKHSKICQAIVTSAATGENIQESMLLFCQLAAQSHQQRQILSNASIEEHHSSSADSLAASSASQLFPSLSVSSEMSVFPMRTMSVNSVNVSMDYYQPARSMTVQSMRPPSFITASPIRPMNIAGDTTYSSPLRPKPLTLSGKITVENAGMVNMNASSDDQSIFTALEDQQIIPEPVTPPPRNNKLTNFTFSNSAMETQPIAEKSSPPKSTSIPSPSSTSTASSSFTASGKGAFTYTSPTSVTSSLPPSLVIAVAATNTTVVSSSSPPPMTAFQHLKSKFESSSKQQSSPSSPLKSSPSITKLSPRLPGGTTTVPSSSSPNKVAIQPVQLQCHRASELEADVEVKKKVKKEEEVVLKDESTTSCSTPDSTKQLLLPPLIVDDDPHIPILYSPASKDPLFFPLTPTSPAPPMPSHSGSGSLLTASEDDLSTESRLIANWIEQKHLGAEIYDYVEEESGARMILSDGMLQDIASRRDSLGDGEKGNSAKDTLPLLGGGEMMEHCYCVIC